MPESTLLPTGDTPAPAAPGERGRLLLIDDDESFLQVLQRALMRRAWLVTTARSADAALAALDAAQDGFDGIVLDLRLGESSGLHLLETLVQRAPHTPVLLLTGYASIATAVEAIKRGAANYLPKPASADEILAALFSNAGDEPALPDTPVNLRRMEWEHLQRVLTEHDGNISSTARALGMHRRSLQRKLAKRPTRER